MSEKEIEYNLKKINESLSGKFHIVTPQYLIELEKRAVERDKQKQQRNDNLKKETV